ncbi:MAG: hypothetical protein AAF329_02010, partial [Cyanobacteria bacterium P01_A01_bin.17]
MNYEIFIAGKSRINTPRKGFEIGLHFLCPESFGSRHQYQPVIVQWALKLGRAAIFAKYGLGKSLMQLHWAKWIAQLGLG